MSRAFDILRSGLTAMVLSSLMILGHVLLTTTANSPLIIHRTPYLSDAITKLSTLTFFTLLWVGFTLLEQADRGVFSHVVSVEADVAGEGEIHQEAGLVHSRTWFQALGGCSLLAAWGVCWPEARLIIAAYWLDGAPELSFIPLSYGLAVLSLSGLQFNLISSIAYHAYAHGIGALNDRTFWNGRVGAWTERIELVQHGEEKV